MGEYRYIDTDEALADVVLGLHDQPRYALDTEFHRERTYWPKVALVQIAWPGELVLVDPLAVDLRRLASIVKSDRIMVLHAAAQDLEVLEHSCGATPQRIFDTQLAAGFLGMGTPSLTSLSDRELGIQLPKSSRLTDWLERPLGEAQLDYAASDVAHLLELHDRLGDQLEKLERRDWAEAEFEVLLNRNRGPREPEEAWRRIKEARHLRGRSVSVARSLAAWRERRAAEIDQPVRFVLSDIATVAISQAAPRSVEELAKVRGVDRGFARGSLGDHVLAAVAEGVETDWRPPRPARQPDARKDLRPAVGLVAAWVNQLARDRAIDPALLATRADIEALMRGDADARLDDGWRAAMVGDPIRRLVAGDVALAFEDGAIVLEERSHQRVV